jgi:DNA-binding LacI/PurR family transcriptional regulator
MTNSASSGNLSDQVIRYVFDEISEGRLKKGDKLPTNRVLVEKLGVSTLTVQRSMKHLEGQGVLSCQRRKGTFLIDPSAMDNPSIKSGIIGLFCPHLSYDFHLDMLTRLEKEIMESGKLLSINFTQSDPEKELFLFRHLNRQKLESLIYVTSPTMIKSEKHNHSVVRWIHRYIKEGTNVIFADLCPKGFESRLVSMDNEHAGYVMTKRLLERGHVKVAFVGCLDTISGQERYHGFLKALKEEGIEEECLHSFTVDIFESKDWIENTAVKLRQFIKEQRLVSGFVVDIQAIATVLNEILCEQEKRLCPAEQSIVSVLETPTPPFPCIGWLKIPGAEIGQRCASIVTCSSSPNIEPGRQLIAGEFYENP